MLARGLLTTLALTASALAQGQAIITLTTITSNGRVNTTITAPVNDAYSQASALKSVSLLTLTDARDVPLDSISCQAYELPSARGANLGPAFTGLEPCLLSTAPVKVGSIVCISSYVALTPPDGLTPIAGGLPLPSHLPSANSTTPETSSRATSSAPSSTSSRASTSATSETRTSSTVASSATGGAAEPTESSASDAPEPSETPDTVGDENGAGRMRVSAEWFAGVAALGLGIAYAL